MKKHSINNSEVYLGDCQDLMSQYPDKWFDLAVVDPPYGIKESKRKSYHPNAFQVYKPKKWDNEVPKKEYWHELFRVSKNQIVWGGNYFTNFLPVSKKWIVWDKKQPEGIDQAMFELAWSSQQKIQSKIYRQSAQSNCNKATNRESAKKYARIHPTQKPVALYDWIFAKYAQKGQKILDTHLGSQSSRIAADKAGLIFTGIEKDSDYFNEGNKRFELYKAQGRLEFPE